MSNPGRRTHAEAADAAQEASAAARVLQERGQQAKVDKPDNTLHLPAKEELKQVTADPVQKTQVVDDLTKHVPRGNIHRDAMMEEIRGNRGEEQAEADALAAVKAAAEAPPGKKPDAVVQQEQTTQVETGAVEQVAEPVAVEMVKVKVDGEESQVAKADVDAEGGVVAYQINRASEKRLKHSNEVLAETRRTQAALAEWAKQQIPAKPQVTDDQFITDKMDTIRFGTPEESSAALREVISRANPRIDQNAVILQATVGMKRDAAIVKYRTVFEDVLANPVLRIAANAIEQNELSKFVTAQGADWGRLGQLDWDKFYGYIGNQVRNAIGPRLHQPAKGDAVPKDGDTSQLSEKEARKASIVEPQKAAAARVASKEEPTLTPEEARQASLREMRKSRGLPVD